MDAWRFPGYEKIAENRDKWKLEPSAYRALSKVQWVVTEKVHGANFCIATDGTQVRGGNRRAWLAEGDAFFGWQGVRDSLAPAILKLFTSLKAARLYVYGELFGGGYPHPGITAVAGLHPVQTGVWYAPDIRFCAFDLRLEDAEGSLRYLDYKEALAHFKEAGIFCAEPLFVGSYEAATEYPIRFDSTLPRRLGLPPLPTGANLAEGVVIKPYREVDVRDALGEVIRPVIKRKIPEFAEDKRFHEAEKWDEATTTDTFAGLPLDLLKWEAYNRITINRRDAAISKIGLGDARRQRMVFALLVTEVLEEAREAVPGAWAALSPHQQNELLDYVKSEIRTLLKAAR